MKLTSLACLGLSLLSPTPSHGLGEDRSLQNSNCFGEMVWSVFQGNILLNGVPFRLKGANWFGFNTSLNILHGLWGDVTMDEVLDFLAANDFNGLRIPLSLSLALDNQTKISQYQCVECTSDLSWDAIERLMDKAAERGLLVLFDFHKLADGESTELWYSDNYPEEKFIEGWVNIIEKFGSWPNFMGIDLFNEPHISATWGKGLETDWNKGAERIVQGIVEQIPTYNKLIFVEGISSGGSSTPYDEDDPANDQFWGSNFFGLYDAEVDFGTPELNKLLVYSPHIYGPDLYDHDYFNASDFPDNMPEIWEKQIGFIESLTGKAVIIGEWGGKMEGKDAILQEKWVQYMLDACISGSFYWSVTPNSGDLGGLLTESWDIPQSGDTQFFKLTLIAEAQPTPSLFTQPISGDQYCLDFGAFADNSCWTNTNSRRDISLDLGNLLVSAENKASKEISNIACNGKMNKENSVCCSAECGQCGGINCLSEVHGASNCCASLILSSEKFCTDNEAPCII